MNPDILYKAHVEALRVRKPSGQWLEEAIEEKVVGKSGAEVSRRLSDGTPRIYSRHRYLLRDMVIIHSINMYEEVAKIVGERLYTAITAE